MDGETGTMVLTRNPNWDPASDPVRHAYPDRWEVHLGIDPEVIERRMLAAEGEDAFALQVGALQPATAARVFDAGGSPTSGFVGRAVSGFAQYTRYMWVNTVRIPNRKIRQAIMVALDRAAIRDIQGGPLFGDFADGVLMPTIGQDYTPTGIWDSYFGRVVPTSGDPELAKELIRASGEAAPKVTFSASNTQRNAAIGEVVVASLARAGIPATYVPFCDGYGCGLVFDPRKGADLGMTGWGADWPNASTVIPVLFTGEGGWNESFVDDPQFEAAVDDALGTLDRAGQARKWQALNRTAVENAWVVPLFFSRTQRLAGPRLAPIYVWAAYNAWPYREMDVTP
jgi:peptide/nickel transport system substrate-binding protein